VYQAVVTARGEYGGGDTASLSIIVSPAPTAVPPTPTVTPTAVPDSPPVISSIEDQQISEGTPLTVAVTTSDIDGDIVILSLKDATTSSVRITSDRNGQGYDTATPGADVVLVTGIVGFDTPGDQVQIVLSDSSIWPINGSVSEIKVLDTGTNVETFGVSVPAIDYTGNGVDAAIVRLQVAFGTGPVGNVDIEYPKLPTDLTNLIVITSIGLGKWDLKVTPPAGSSGIHTVTIRASANGLIDEDVFTITVTSP